MDEGNGGLHICEKDEMILKGVILATTIRPLLLRDTP